MTYTPSPRKRQALPNKTTKADAPRAVEEARARSGLYAVVNNNIIHALYLAQATAIQLRALVCLMALAQRQHDRRVGFGNKQEFLKLLGPAVTTKKYYDTVVDMRRVWENIEFDLDGCESGQYTHKCFRIFQVRQKGEGFVVYFDAAFHKLNADDMARGYWSPIHLADINRLSRPQHVLLYTILVAMPKAMHKPGWGRSKLARRLGVHDPDMWQFMRRLENWVALINKVLKKNFKVWPNGKKVCISDQGEGGAEP